MHDIAISRRQRRGRLYWAITQQEILNLIRHPQYLLTLAIPIFMSLVFGLVFPSLSEADALRVVVYDAGDSTWGSTLGAWSDVKLETAASDTALLAAVHGNTTAGLIIPADFDTAVAANQLPELIVYLNADASTENVAVFKQLLSESVWAIEGRAAPALLTWQEVNAPAQAALPFASTGNYIALLFLLVGVVLLTINMLPWLMVEKRENGTLPVLLASPVEPADLIIGQGLAAYLFTLLLAAVLLTINRGWMGNVGLTAVTILLASAMLVGLGLLLGLWLESKSQCNTYAGIAGILLLIPSWFVLTPLTELPLLVAWGVRLLPTYYFAKVLAYSFNGEASLAIVGSSLVVLLGCTVIIFLLIGWRLRQRPLGCS